MADQDGLSASPPGLGLAGEMWVRPQRLESRGGRDKKRKKKEQEQNIICIIYL